MQNQLSILPNDWYQPSIVLTTSRDDISPIWHSFHFLTHPVPVIQLSVFVSKPILLFQGGWVICAKEVPEDDEELQLGKGLP